MNIKIHRGQNQIGGNIIEIATAKTKILLDVGLELDVEKNNTPPDIPGLFDYNGFDAIFLSHYHEDHMGLAYRICASIPIFMGEESFKITNAAEFYKKGDKSCRKIIPAGFMKHKTPIQIGDIKVTPYLCDHSAFDSYMIMVEANGESILYTGDFRANGRKSFDHLLKQLPKNIDTLICEGTTLSREGYKTETEQDIEKNAAKLFKETDGPIFILQSAMNIDRIVTMFRAAKKSNRIFLEDLYTAEITNSIGGSIPNPVGFSEVKTFITRPYKKDHYRYRLFDKYGGSKISKAQISKSQFVMCVRTSMLEYMTSLSMKMSFQNGLLIYSLWSGYQEKEDMQNFITKCENMGLTVKPLHTSGHADPNTIKRLIEHTNPKKIIPIHTENPGWFEKEYEEKTEAN